MNNLFDFDKEGNLVFSKHALLIKQFKEIWDRDRSLGHRKALQEFMYVYCMSDYKSEYNGYGIEKEKTIIEDVITIKNWKPDEVVKDAIEKYNELQLTSSMRHLMSIKKGLESLTEYYKTLIFDGEDKESILNFDPTKLQKALKNTDEMMDMYLKVEKKVLGEEVDARIRGAGKIGVFEDKESMKNLF